MASSTRASGQNRQEQLNASLRNAEAARFEFSSGGGTFSSSLPKLDKDHANALLARVLKRSSGHK